MTETNPIIRLMTQKAPLLMGIVNLTPDSFSDGGQFLGFDAAFAHAKKLIEQGADIIDIGGESTRPGSAEVSVKEELARTIPLISALRKQSKIPISIDTRKPEVATKAIKAGASIWNDVSALSFSAKSIAAAAKLNVPIILMHAQGLPENMQDNPSYKDVTTDVLAILAAKMGKAIAGGVKRENIILDIGIGFGKTAAHNLALIANLHRFAQLGRPLLVGASRKRFINAVDTSANDPKDRLGGSIAVALMAAQSGAAILRVHDVKETNQALMLQQAVWESRY